MYVKYLHFCVLFFCQHHNLTEQTEFTCRWTNSGRLLGQSYHLTQHYTAIDINNQFFFFFLILPGIVKFIPKDMELLANKHSKHG